MKNERKMTQIDHCTFGPASKTSPTQLFSARAAAPRPQPRPGPAKPHRCARLPGPRVSPIKHRRRIAFDGHPQASRGQNHARAATDGNPRSFAPVLSLASQPSTTEREREQRPWRARRWSEPWRRRRPPRRRACSPTGEHAAVERPGRGAPLGRARRAAAPGSALLLPRRRRFSRGEVGLSPLFPLLL